MNLKNKAICFCVGLLLPLSLFALKSDDSKPLQITSDQFEYNGHLRKATYKGHVVAIQGSRRLESNQLSLKQNQSGQTQSYRAFAILRER